MEALVNQDNRMTTKPLKRASRGHECEGDRQNLIPALTKSRIKQLRRTITPGQTIQHYRYISKYTPASREPEEGAINKHGKSPCPANH